MKDNRDANIRRRRADREADARLQERLDAPCEGCLIKSESDHWNDALETARLVRNFVAGERRPITAAEVTALNVRRRSS